MRVCVRVCLTCALNTKSTIYKTIKFYSFGKKSINVDAFERNWRARTHAHTHTHTHTHTYIYIYIKSSWRSTGQQYRCEFELQLCYYVNLHTYTLGKYINLFFLPATG